MLFTKFFDLYLIRFSTSKLKNHKNRKKTYITTENDVINLTSLSVFKILYLPATLIA